MLGFLREASKREVVIHDHQSESPHSRVLRQYWRDMESLLQWSRSEPHRQWWKNFLKDSGGTGFWYETYLMQGGMEAIYDDVPGALVAVPSTTPASEDANSESVSRFTPIRISRRAIDRGRAK